MKNPSETRPRGRGMTLWERLSSDPRYLRASREIQARYGLPLGFEIRSDRQRWLAWLGMTEGSGREEVERGQAFLNEVQALFREFQVPESWQPDFIAEIAGRSVGASNDARPGLSGETAGDRTWQGNLTPTLDPTPPELTPSQQKELVDTPPWPALDSDHPGTLDWSPVYRWYKRHPSMTIEDIARQVGDDPRTLRQRFAELERGGNNETRAEKAARRAEWLRGIWGIIRKALKRRK